MPYWHRDVHSSVLHYYEELFYQKLKESERVNSLSPGLLKFFNPGLRVTAYDAE